METEDDYTYSSDIRNSQGNHLKPYKLNSNIKVYYSLILPSAIFCAIKDSMEEDPG